MVSKKKKNTFEKKENVVDKEDAAKKEENTFVIIAKTLTGKTIFHQVTLFVMLRDIYITKKGFQLSNND